MTTEAVETKNAPDPQADIAPAEKNVLQRPDGSKIALREIDTTEKYMQLMGPMVGGLQALKSLEVKKRLLESEEATDPEYGIRLADINTQLIVLSGRLRQDLLASISRCAVDEVSVEDLSQSLDPRNRDGFRAVLNDFLGHLNSQIPSKETVKN